MQAIKTSLIPEMIVTFVLGATFFGIVGYIAARIATA